jgi:Ca2+-binding EF-hand superfamily protein
MQLLIIFGVLLQAAALRSKGSAAPGPAPSATPGPAPGVAHAPAPSAPVVNRSQAIRDIIETTKDDTLTEEAFDSVNPTFSDFDCLTKDGVITVNEAATFGVKNGVPWSEIKPVFQHVDANSDGKITSKEFSAEEDSNSKLFQDLRAGFADIDLDGDGLISNDEWMGFCHGWMTPHPPEKLCKQLFKVADTSDPKNMVNRQEFEQAGKECDSVDDGNCYDAKRKTDREGKKTKDKDSSWWQWAGWGLLQKKSVSMAQVVGGASRQQTGGQLFAVLFRRHHRH